MHDTLSDVVTDDAPATDPSVVATPAARVNPPATAPLARGQRPDPWRLHVLGPVELSYDGRPVEVAGIARTLLALLARTPGQEVDTASIVANIWGTDVPDDAENTIASNVSRLRKALTAVAPDVNPTSVVVTMPAGYILHIGAANVDAESFERLLADGRRALSIGQPALALERLDAALALWRGTAYEDFGDQVFTRLESERLEDLRLAAVESRIEAILGLSSPGVPPTLLDEVHDLCQEYWHRERLWGLLMTMLYRLGRRSEALAVFRAAEERLADGMTIRPSAALKAVERSVLANNQALLGVPVPHFAVPDAVSSTVPACVGRDEEIAWLMAGLDLAATRRAQARLVVGSPGIGKTRLLTEIAQRAAERGVVVRYARADHGLADVLRLAPDLLNLILIDDLDLASHDDLVRVADFIRANRDEPVLTLLGCRDIVRVGELSGLPKVVLSALGDAGIGEIVRLYAPNTSTPTAVSAMINTGGVPGRVHRAASRGPW